MAEFFMMPASSPTMEVGRLANWICAEGDAVEFGTVVAEVETDKATAEIESFDDGVLLKFFQPAGSDVAVGTPIAIIGEEDDDISDLVAQFESGATSAVRISERRTCTDTRTSAVFNPLSKPVLVPGYKQMQVVFPYHQSKVPDQMVVCSVLISQRNHRVQQKLRTTLGTVNHFIVPSWKCLFHSHQAKTIQNVEILVQVQVVVPKQQKIPSLQTQ